METAGVKEAFTSSQEQWGQRDTRPSTAQEKVGRKHEAVGFNTLVMLQQGTAAPERWSEPMVPQLPALRCFWITTQGMGSLGGAQRLCEVRGWTCESREVKATRAYRREGWRKESKDRRETSETQRGPGGDGNIQHIGTAGEGPLARVAGRSCCSHRPRDRTCSHQPDNRTSEFRKWWPSWKEFALG